MLISHKRAAWKSLFHRSPVVNQETIRPCGYFFPGCSQTFELNLNAFTLTTSWWTRNSANAKGPNKHSVSWNLVKMLHKCSTDCIWTYFLHFTRHSGWHFSGVVDRFKNTYVEFHYNTVYQKLLKSVYFFRTQCRQKLVKKNKSV